MRSAIPLMLLLCLPAAAQPLDDEAPRAIVARAVNAHGGVAGINRLRVAKVTYVMKGDFAFLGLRGGMDMSVEDTYDLPRRIKKVLTGNAARVGETRIAWAIDGARHWYKQRGHPLNVYEQQTNVAATYRPFQLIELLAADDLLQWSIAPGDAGKDNALVAVVGTSRATGTELTFFFCKATSLLVRAGGWNTLPQPPRKVLISTQMGDYRSIDGVKLPMEQTISHDGKNSAVLRISDVQFFDHLDDGVFAPPRSGFLYVVLASIVAALGCFLAGRIVGARLGRKRVPAISAAGFTGAIGATAGALPGIVIIGTVESLGFDTEPATRLNLALGLTLAGFCAAFAGAALANRNVATVPSSANWSTPP